MTIAYAQLQRAVRERLQARSGETYRVYVAAGGCGISLGALDVISALQREVARRGVAAAIIEAGCDGACYEAPSLWVRRPDGRLLRFASVSADAVPEIVARWLASPSPAEEWRGVATDWSVQRQQPFWQGQQRLVTSRIGRVDPESIDEYIADGGYGALATVLGSVPPESVVAAVKERNIRGRGGAYFPAGVKWESARSFPAPRYLLVNAEEGEPGAFKDRHLMEGDPHRLLEGVIIAAYAIEAEKAYIYVNGQARRSAARVQRAIEDAKARGLLGQNILDSGYSLDIEVRMGAGGYVCGEESVILESIEGERAMPRLRPPFPTEAGLWGRPTVINNVETLANVPLVWSEGGYAAQAGTTKIICLSGSVQRPGLIEIALGTPLRHVLYDIGGGPLPGQTIKGIVAGGPSGGLLPESLLDLEAQPGFLHESGAVLGSGGMIVLDDSVSIVEVARRLTDYNARESCGKCTPCREGTYRLREYLDRLLAGQGSRHDLDDITELNRIVASASLCGLGQMAPSPIRSAFVHFSQEFEGLINP